MEGIGRNIYPAFGVKLKTNSQEKIQQPTNENQVAKLELDTVEQPKTSNQKKKKIIIGAAITAMLTTYTAAFYRKNIANYAAKFVDKIYSKSDGYKKHGANAWDAMSLGLARYIDKGLSSTQLFVNFSAMKDSVSDRIARALKMGPLCDKLSATWEKLAAKAVKANYNSCDKSFEKTYEEIINITQNLRKNDDLNRIIQVDGENYALGHVIKQIEKNMREARTRYNKEFSISAFETRNKYLKERLNSINEEFRKAYTSWKYYKKFEFTRFTAEEMLAPVKMTYQKNLMTNKAFISNNIDDKFIATYQLLRNFDNIIAPKDVKSRKIIREIYSKLKEYRDLSGKSEKTQRRLLTQDIEKSLNLLMEQIQKNPKYEQKNLERMSNLVEEMKRTVNMGKKGKLQETLTYLKAVLPEAEYKKIRSQVYNTTDKLNNVVQGEGDLYFDKLRDIVLGSAFSDIIFGMVTPLATMGAVLAMDETKEERISTTLKLGIPLIGGVATSTAFLFLLASGGKALILSSLIGLGLNRIGTYADNKLVQNRIALKDKHPKANNIINNVNLASTILSNDPTTLVVDKAINKSVNESIRFANSQLTKLKNVESKEATPVIS